VINRLKSQKNWVRRRLACSMRTGRPRTQYCMSNWWRMGEKCSESQLFFITFV